MKTKLLKHPTLHITYVGIRSICVCLRMRHSPAWRVNGSTALVARDVRARIRGYRARAPAATHTH